jgi:hypothetical protein
MEGNSFFQLTNNNKEMKDSKQLLFLLLLLLLTREGIELSTKTGSPLLARQTSCLGYNVFMFHFHPMKTFPIVHFI